ncbi:Uncharacterised protein [BD1-7 clade bacterium]|uniref:Pyridoxamine 5'-phosphate oxidase putative domain-containing protein n=1 Tax=BD1-7 clade bacterium TaxID=2029982 RepID=A0A5S9MNU1_9GAMM|nr:Uncharacterised protein [BD1-7 clade bacterium]
MKNPTISLCLLCDEDFTRYIEIRGHAVLEDDLNSRFFLAMWKRLTDLDSFDFDPPGAERVTITVIAEQVSTPLLYGGKMSANTQHKPNAIAPNTHQAPPPTP